METGLGLARTLSVRWLWMLAGALMLGGGEPARAVPASAGAVRLVVGASPSGPTDLVARLFADALGRVLGGSVVVDNRPGAGGVLAARAVANAPADGHTLLVAGPGPVVVAPALHRRLGYDPARDLVPVALLGESALVLAVHPSVPARSVDGLIALARRRPGALAYASAGDGSTAHLSAELFASRAGIRLLHVPYDGDGRAQNDLLGGAVQLMFMAPNAALPHVRAGRLHALAVTAMQRLAALPDTPTIDEAGLAGFAYGAWIAVFAPAGTPRAVVERLGDACDRVRAQPAVAARLDAAGLLPSRQAPDRYGLAAFVQTERSRLAKVIREAGLGTQ